MKIALIGYGKMGRLIEQLATENGDSVVLKINSQNLHDLTEEALRQADVAIEFTHPESAFDNLALCLQAGVPVVTGTTGWLDRLPEAAALCRQYEGALFYASNFSIGVHLFFAVNRYLAALMNDQTAYDVVMEEIHHAQKKDYPSGTALSLAHDILKTFKRKTSIHPDLEHIDSELLVNELSILSKRTGEVPGTHLVRWQSEIDTLEITHTAHSRRGFAAGALTAARWLRGRKGIYEMKDMLGN